MSEVMTAEEMRAWRAWENGSPSRREFARICAAFDAREAKLVEALRSLHAWSRCFVEDTPITAETLWRAFPAAVKRAGEVLADHPYDAPAVQMPGGCHPQEG